MLAGKLLHKILIILSMFSWVTIQAQTRPGIFLTYGAHQENLGIGALGEFFVKENISVSPNLIYFFPKDDNEFSSTDHWFDLNLNGNYYFQTGTMIIPYGLAGLNYAFRKFEFDGGGSEKVSSLGFNIGAGADFDLESQFFPFTEIRYTFGDSSQLVISAGLKIEIQ